MLLARAEVISAAEPVPVTRSRCGGPLMRSSRARKQRANERFLPLPLEGSFRWFHEALVFETSLRSMPPSMFVGLAIASLLLVRTPVFRRAIGSLLRRSLEFTRAVIPG